MQMAKFELTRLSNRVRFILAVISGEMVINNRKRVDIEAQLEADGYNRMPNTKKKVGRSTCSFGGCWKNQQAQRVSCKQGYWLLKLS